MRQYFFGPLSECFESMNCTLEGIAVALVDKLIQY
jgi:hypothetical protein